MYKLQSYRPDTITLNCDSEDFRIHGGLIEDFNVPAYKIAPFEAVR
jgi:hypothetical protein